MKYTAYHYSQNQQDFLSLVLPFKHIKNNTYVLTYGDENKLGYQRKLDERHVKKIKEQLIDGKDFLLPTSIILSIDEKDLLGLLTKDTNIYGKELLEIEFLSDRKVFRIVDGQHRLAGLTEASEKRKDLNEFMLSVIILITNPSSKTVEVEVFRDINSKAKKLRTDLTQLSLFNHELLGMKKIESEVDLIRHLSSRVAFYLNETSDNLKKVESNVWSNAILIDIHDDGATGIIGFSSFINSIKPIVKKYIEEFKIDKLDIKSESVDLVDLLDKHAISIAKIIIEAWEVVDNKWAGCFVEDIVYRDQAKFPVFYNKNFYLQKTTGTNAIHLIIHETIKFIPEKNEWDFSEFKKIISKSEVIEKDWIIGGRFSGMTSGSGFKKAKKIIESDGKRELLI